LFLVGGFDHLEKNEFVNGKGYPIYYGNEKMFETTNQVLFSCFSSSSNQSSPLPRSNQHIKVHLLGKLVDGTPHEPVGIWWFPLPILDTLQKNKFFAG
jgi:hypothetical protein